jgi:hypothetical protein
LLAKWVVYGSYAFTAMSRVILWEHFR